MNSVILKPSEIYIGAIVGVRRNLSKLESKTHNKVNNKDFGWHTDIEAACAEVAFAKWMGVYWEPSVGTYKNPDVGGFQVRHTQHLEGKLIVREADDPGEQFVLVVGTAPQYHVIGWFLGAEAKTKQHEFKGFNGMPDCWMVEQRYLNPWQDLHTRS